MSRKKTALEKAKELTSRALRNWRDAEAVHRHARAEVRRLDKIAQKKWSAYQSALGVLRFVEMAEGAPRVGFDETTWEPGFQEVGE